MKDEVLLAVADIKIRMRKVNPLSSSALKWQDTEKDNDPVIVLREAREAYRQHQKSWGRQYAGQYIAIYKGNVIASNPDEETLLDWLIQEQKQKGAFRACIMKVKKLAQQKKSSRKGANTARSKREAK